MVGARCSQAWFASYLYTLLHFCLCLRCLLDFVFVYSLLKGSIYDKNKLFYMFLEKQTFILRSHDITFISLHCENRLFSICRPNTTFSYLILLSHGPIDSTSDTAKSHKMAWNIENIDTILYMGVLWPLGQREVTSTLVLHIIGGFWRRETELQTMH